MPEQPKKRGQSVAKYRHLRGDGRCVAADKHTGERCKNHAVNGRDVCRMHGGTSRTGAAAGNWRHGKYSLHVPASIKQVYEEALNDPTLLELADEAAVIETLLSAELQQIDEGGLPDMAAFAEMFALVAEHGWRCDEQEWAAKKLARAIERAANSQAAKGRAVELIRRKAEVVKAEADRKKTLGAMLPVADALNLVERLFAILVKHIKDQGVLDAVASDLTAVAGGPVGLPAPDGEPPQWGGEQDLAEGVLSEDAHL